MHRVRRSANADSVAVDDDRIVPVALDVTNAADVEAAAAACGDSALVINNAGLMLQSPFISVRNEDAARVAKWRPTTSEPWKSRVASRPCSPRMVVAH